MNKKILSAALVIIPKRLQQQAIAKAFNFLFADVYSQLSGLGIVAICIDDLNKNWQLYLSDETAKPHSTGGGAVVKVSTSLETLIACQSKPNLIKALDEHLVIIEGSSTEKLCIEQALRNIQQERLEQLIGRCYHFLRIKRPARLNIYSVTINDVKTAQDVEFLRDKAIELEHDNIELALKLMELAHQARPSGPLINEKLKQYRNAVRC